MRRPLALLLFLAACGGATPAAQSSAPTTTKASEAAGPDLDGVPAPPAVALDCGDFTTCAIATDGVVRCWGSNQNGELGLPKSEKERTKRTTVPGLGGKATSVAMASEMACALLENKKVMCWGTGRLKNDGQEESDAKAMPVDGVEDIEELAASGTMICARGKGITCWGADQKTLGTPPTGAFKQIAAGFTHACALDDKGAVTCWGQGEWGGKGGFAKPAVTGALSVVTGDRHGCIITKDKTVQCWGMNDAGQLGTKPDGDRHTKLVTVPGVKPAAKLFVGETSSCAILADGTTKCWGSNSEGELGLGTRSSDERPQTVSGLAGAEAICFASSHACALMKDQKLMCWGANAYGQIGDGTKERRPDPTAVAW